MASRLLDFLFALALIVLACSGTTLMLYALWHIGQRVIRAMHTLLTCWDYQEGHYEAKRLLLGDPVMQDILAMRSPFRRAFAPFFRYSRDLRRLYLYRYEKAREQAIQMIWDRRLGALLTRDEHDFLYGPDEPPAGGNVPVPLEPVQPVGSAAATV